MIPQLDTLSKYQLFQVKVSPAGTLFNKSVDPVCGTEQSWEGKDAHKTMIARNHVQINESPMLIVYGACVGLQRLTPCVVWVPECAVAGYLEELLTLP